MNKIFGKIAICLALAAPCVGLYSCSEPDDEITSIEYDRLFRPTDFKASGATESTVEFAWDCISSADNYIIEIFAGDEEMQTVLNESAVPTMSFTTSKNPFVAKELEEQTVYSARIKAVGSSKESKWAIIDKTFKTKKAADPEPPAPVEQTAHLEFEVGAVAESYTCGCIDMLINNANGKFAIDANTQYFGNTEAQKKYTARLKSGGNSSANNGVTLVCKGSGTMVIAMRSSSSSADRTVTITKAGEDVAKFVVGDSNADKGVAIPGEAEPKTVFHTYEVAFTPGSYEISYDGGLNFYGIDATYVSSDEPIPDPEPVGPTGEAGELSFGDKADGAIADGQTYTAGSLGITINNANGKYTIDGNTQYFGDDKAQTKYTKRLKSGGNSSSNNGMTLNVAAKGVVTIAMRSSSSSADRNVAIMNGDAEVAKFTVSDSNATKDVTIAGEEAPKTVFKTYTVTLEPGTYTLSYDGGTNFYSIQFDPAK